MCELCLPNVYLHSWGKEKVDGEVASQIWKIIKWEKYWVLWFQMKLYKKSEMSLKVHENFGIRMFNVQGWKYKRFHLTTVAGLLGKSLCDRKVRYVVCDQHLDPKGVWLTVSGPNSPYPWDYWPHEDGRSDCGYVGLTNLGATCYMASCMQHLYMMPQARTSILRAKCDNNSKHEHTLRELQRMFAYLLVSGNKIHILISFLENV